jgi:hypothetical protein
MPLILLAVAVFSVLWYVVWRKVGGRILASDRYWLTRENVEIPPPPDWIQGDIRIDAFRDASLDFPLSIMDDDLTARIANAFSLQPWVARVHRVSKFHPARVRVELHYRRPACVVHVRGDLLLVDGDGVLLPNVSPEEAGRFPRLEGVDTIPIGPEGTRWGDVKVSGGARIAAAFGPAWAKLGLDRIVPCTLVAVDRADQYTYELVTRGGRRIFWGRPPGMEAPEETRAADKVAWLLDYRQRNGSLEASGRAQGVRELDVRSLTPRHGAPRTAGKPKEEIR